MHDVGNDKRRIGNNKEFSEHVTSTDATDVSGCTEQEKKSHQMRKKTNARHLQEHVRM